jgi:hypothetical protein
VPYETTISAVDLSGGVPDVRITAGYTWNVAGEPRTMDNVTLDVAPNEFLSATTPVNFGYAGSLAPPPSADWYIGLWIQEVPRIANGTGWLFRSGGFTTEPPQEPIEVILAPERFVGPEDIARDVGPLPFTSGTTTITSITPVVVGADVLATANGTDTRLPSGITFTYTMTIVLTPNDNIQGVDFPFKVRLANAGLHFNAAPGTGFGTAVLNALADLLEGEIAPRVTATITGLVNAGVLSEVATQLNRGTPSSLPPGVVLSIRSVRATTRPTAAGGTDNVIGVRAALASFGGVLNKFPALSSGGRCFVATAASNPGAPEVELLRIWRERRLRRSRGGRIALAAYERIAPTLGAWVARTERRRAVVRALVVGPAARLADRSLRRASSGLGSRARPTNSKTMVGSRTHSPSELGGPATRLAPRTRPRAGPPPEQAREPR